MFIGRMYYGRMFQNQRVKGIPTDKLWHMYNGHWLRFPKTQQEKRATQTRGTQMEIDGYTIKIRGKRNIANLPDAYDDIRNHSKKSAPPVWGNQHYSWKKLRKTRYKREGDGWLTLG